MATSWLPHDLCWVQVKNKQDISNWTIVSFIVQLGEYFWNKIQILFVCTNHSLFCFCFLTKKVKWGLNEKTDTRQIKLEKSDSNNFFLKTVNLDFLKCFLYISNKSNLTKHFNACKCKNLSSIHNSAKISTINFPLTMDWKVSAIDGN